MIVPFPTETLLAEVGRFDDELSAYLWFDYLRSRPGVEGSQVLLTVSEKEGAPLYRIEVELPNNALVAIPFLAQLEAKAFIEGFELGFSTKQVTERKREQTNLFVQPTKDLSRRNSSYCLESSYYALWSISWYSSRGPTPVCAAGRNPDRRA
jgi:hypothetical protein